MDAFQAQVARLVSARTGRPVDEVLPLLGAPKQPEHGDVALPCFKLAAALGRTGRDAAPALAAELAAALATAGPPILGAEAAGPYLNVRLDPTAVAREVLGAIAARPVYGGSDEGAGKTIVIDFSSPNIAKPFHLGHLRSTVIGWSLRQVFRALGYRVVGVNHLGDWGTQFGLMMAAWTRWRDEAEGRLAAGERDIDVFYALYVRINDLKKQDARVAEEGRAWFKRLEDADPEARRLWTFFVERSKAEFQRIYDVLGIVHESDAGEAFYNDKMSGMVALLERSGLLVEGKSRVDELAEARSELEEARAETARLEAARGAAPAAEQKKLDKDLARKKARAGELGKRITALEAQLAAAAAGDDEDDQGPADRRPRGVKVDVGEHGFAMLLKGDGGTTYTTRDLTACRYRAETYRPAQVLYVVGNTQRDHFIPWFDVVRQLAAKGEAWAQGLQLVHVGFGNYLGMSTRKGTAVFLEEVIARAREAAREAAEAADKKIDLTAEQREQVARAIGVGALKFFDLKGARTNDIDLAVPGQEGAIDWARLLNLKGDSGPYLQFAHARLAGILRRLGAPPPAPDAVDPRALADAEAQALLKALAAFPGKVRQAAAEHEPSVVSRYLLELAAKIHQFVHVRRVLDAGAEGQVPAEAVRAARAALVAASKKVLAEGLGLLGIEAVEVM